MLVLELLDSLLSNSSTSYKEKEEGLLKFLSNEEEKQKCIGWRNSRRKKSKFYADEEEDMRYSVKILCNSRPPIDFMYYRKTKNQNDANDVQLCIGQHLKIVPIAYRYCWKQVPIQTHVLIPLDGHHYMMQPIPMHLKQHNYY